MDGGNSVRRLSTRRPLPQRARVEGRQAERGYGAASRKARRSNETALAE
jgi:hypothetical protein